MLEDATANEQIKNKELKMDYSVPFSPPKKNTLIFYQTKRKTKSTMDIYKEIMSDDDSTKPENHYNKNTNITAKLLLPLIGSDPKTQKKVLEDSEFSFKIKLKKVKRFKNRSENFDRNFIEDGANKSSKIFSSQIIFPANMTNKKFQQLNNPEARKTNNNPKTEEKKNRTNSLVKSSHNSSDKENKELLKQTLKLENSISNAIETNLNSIENTTRFQNKTLRQLQNQAIQISPNEIPPSHKYFIPKHNSLSQREKEKLLNHYNNKNLEEQNNNQGIYFFKKFFDLERKYSPEVHLHEENKDYPHPCIRGETSFKQYPYRSLDNQIKTKNFLEKEYFKNKNNLNGVNNVSHFKQANGNNLDENSKSFKDYNNQITHKQIAEGSLKDIKKRGENGISSNINANLPSDNANAINQKEYNKLNELLGEKSKKAGNLNNISKVNVKSLNKLTKYSELISSRSQVNSIINENKNDIFDSDNILLNSKNKEFLGNKDILAFNEHYVNYILKKNLKNNFKKIIKISNFDSNKKNKINIHKVGINSNNSNMINLNSNKNKDKKLICNDYSVKNSYLNDQLNVTPKNLIPLEIRYLIEKKVIPGYDFGL